MRNTSRWIGRRLALYGALSSTLAACVSGDGGPGIEEASASNEESGDTDPDSTEGDTTGGDPIVESCDPDVAYPAGPYGFEEGDTLANFQFEGYRDGVAPWGDICLSDYYDPDGSRGIRALYLTRGHILCGACVQEAPKINEWKAKYAPHGATFLSALWAGASQSPDGSFPITQSGIDAWIDEFSIGYDMVMDPEIQLAGGVEPPTDPIGWLVDTRTMKIFHVYGGSPGFLQYMPELLEQNGATDVPP